MRITYDKLVRDHVPAAIEADGHTFRVDVLSKDDYVAELKRKLIEESREALEASTHDELVLELADLLEVIRALSTAAGISCEALETLRAHRRDLKGGFERRLFLRYVERVDT